MLDARPGDDRAKYNNSTAHPCTFQSQHHAINTLKATTAAMISLVRTSHSIVLLQGNLLRKINENRLCVFVC